VEHPHQFIFKHKHLNATDNTWKVNYFGISGYRCTVRDHDALESGSVADGLPLSLVDTPKLHLQYYMK
jgi:hypothetical protein